MLSSHPPSLVATASSNSGLTARFSLSSLAFMTPLWPGVKILVPENCPLKLFLAAWDNVEAPFNLSRSIGQHVNNT